MCDSIADCQPKLSGTQRIDGRCRCPDPKEEICCKLAAKEEKPRLSNTGDADASCNDIGSWRIS